MLNATEVLEEIKLMLEHITVGPIHFTSDHASNYLPLKGSLPEDKEKLLALIDKALEGKVRLRGDEWRGL